MRATPFYPCPRPCSTNWSGLTDFLRPSVSYPIRVEGIVEVPDGPDTFEWFRWGDGGGSWGGICKGLPGGCNAWWVLGEAEGGLLLRAVALSGCPRARGRWCMCR